MEGIFFRGSEVERKLLRHFFFQLSRGSQLKYQFVIFFFPALHSGEALVYLCSIQLFAEASSWDVFNQKSHVVRPAAFFRKRQCPWSVWWVCCCLCWVPWSPNLKRTKSTRYMMWLPTIVLEIWGFPKKPETSRHQQRHCGFWHGCFASDIWSSCNGDREKNCTAGKFWKVPSWQVGACHRKAGGSERTRKTFMSCLRVWVS